MKIPALTALILFAAAGWAAAGPLTQTGKAGPVVAVVSGASGPVVLLHKGAVVKEVPSEGSFSAAVVLEGPDDSVQWEGAAAVLLPVSDDPEGAGRLALAGRTEDLVFLLKSDGKVDALKAPDGWTDATAAASAEE